MKKKALSGLLAPFLLGGCAALMDHPTRATPHCTTAQAQCRLVVNVTGNCKVSVSPDEEYVVDHRQGGVEMVWTIQGGTFAPDGIDFNARPVKPLPTTPGNPAGVFSASRPPAASEIRFRNTTQRGYFYYTVNVNQGGTRCPPHDPGIANQ